MTAADHLLHCAKSDMAIRVYGERVGSAAAPVVLHLHGGAFVEGSLDSGQLVAGLLADSGAIVISAAYPLSPEQCFPTPLGTAFEALNWVFENRARFGTRKSQIVVAGEEAGGNLAAALALMARDRRMPPLAGQILLSPMLDPGMSTGSMRDACAGPVGCKWADGWHQYLGTADKASHPYAAPLGSTRLAGLAPALIITAEDDLFHDESLAYAARLRQAGVPVTEHVLAAPTHWPCALSDPALTAPAWAAELRSHIASFFAEIAKTKGAAASFKSRGA
ncbi:acetyl esterase/lipase [Rhodoligotrophos appendicifer]|uniref:alpha/beta hydrolase n=1 Tax=Rhodoligotrophos appendicifer TaxID=987056 RepID=UPI0011860C73|nr:alpha/beta hydrolase [Rhodoligotrophos appendicifer]